MSKWLALSFTSLLILSSCQEQLAESMPEPTAYESTSVLQLHPSTLNGGIDWNLGFALLEKEEVLQQAADIAEVEVQTLDEATSFKADVEQSQLRIIARHADADTAKKLANSLAEAFLEAFKKAEIERATAQLKDLDRKLMEQSEAVQKHRRELETLIEKYAIPSFDQEGDSKPLDRDRMTYEKALQALDDEEAKNGILYQKKD